ncbi:MAG: DUF305 domain-containing protein [Acidobacteriota bacterium]|nr:DUF305 domain-containing protein [Acidobacteriota bacterium]MDQ3419242.1 DUF305 domain-containing protein [Acidobacteriota bacterium]
MSDLQRHLATLIVSLAVSASASLAWAQSAPIVQPGAPGKPSRIITPEQAARLRPGASAADVKFMQGMIGHHAQAVEMTELLETRTRSATMRKLAERIQVSQDDEMKMMREWLESHGAAAPGEHAHHAPGAPLMPGMLTAQEMDRLTAASGESFDRLFLEYMIKHHEGALVMVKDLFATPGAAQDADIYAFASDVNADQRMEIARMTAMLKELQK